MWSTHMFIPSGRAGIIIICFRELLNWLKSTQSSFISTGAVILPITARDSWLPILLSIWKTTSQTCINISGFWKKPSSGPVPIVILGQAGLKDLRGYGGVTKKSVQWESAVPDGLACMAWRYTSLQTSNTAITLYRAD